MHATREVIEGGQALEDRAQHDHRPVNGGDEDLVETVELVQRTERGGKFGMCCQFRGEGTGTAENVSRIA
ncbi:MAG: hypothetical protein DWQ31_07010 [Planctomycetota bacterium]|nr:MAG: hypothetical protein DWQ31_07010 [Planctomycetota bacterium]REJ89545.1 MAG: hypothetical protein DWQ35_17805 [Planctomycetota bacterium]REK31408.1 MAG: hypothetical protein DWQ42_00315 [Planctomycetota bacterium]REK40638.1 MAG: hypothetical protein DWQ46_15455 [Planctomycetota bacterium]